MRTWDALQQWQNRHSRMDWSANPCSQSHQGQSRSVPPLKEMVMWVWLLFVLQTERVKFFRTVLRGPELTNGNLQNFVFTYCWRCNYWCSNWSCATVPVGPAIMLTVFWADTFTTWACNNRIKTEQSSGSCQDLGPWGDNSMHSKRCLMPLGFCRWPWLTRGCNPHLSQYIRRARPFVGRWLQI